MTHPITLASVFTSGAKTSRFGPMTPEMAFVSSWSPIEFAGRKRRRVGDAPLGASKGHVEQRALPGHQRGQSPDLVEVSLGVIAQATLERSSGPVVLDPIAPKGQNGPVVGVDRHLHVDLSIRLGHQNPDVLFDAEQRAACSTYG